MISPSCLFKAVTATFFLSMQILAAPQIFGEAPVSRHINPNTNTEFCMAVKDTAVVNGSLVVLAECSPHGTWTITEDSDTTVVWNEGPGTSFCLDAGSNPGNGVPLKVWECFGLGLQAQHWYYTADKRIALAGQGLCVDLENGNLIAGNTIQTWQCTDGNTNQIWIDNL